MCFVCFLVEVFLYHWDMKEGVLKHVEEEVGSKERVTGEER